MGIEERKEDPYKNTLARFALYALGIAFTLGFLIVEMKTGICIGRHCSDTAVHDPWSWREVWMHLPDEGFTFLAILMIFVAFELWVRFGRSEPETDTYVSLEDSPAKPFTRPWLIVTFGYLAVLFALGMYSRSHWARDMPLPIPESAAFAPVFVSLGLLAIYTGEVQLRGGTLYRNKNPFFYWLCVAIALSLGIFMFLVGIGIIGQ